MAISLCWQWVLTEHFVRELDNVRRQSLGRYLLLMQPAPGHRARIPSSRSRSTSALSGRSFGLMNDLSAAPNCGHALSAFVWNMPIPEVGATLPTSDAWCVPCDDNRDTIHAHGDFDACPMVVPGVGPRRMRFIGDAIRERTRTKNERPTECACRRGRGGRAARSRAL